MGSKLSSNLTRVLWSLNALIKGITRKHVVMIQAPCHKTVLLPVVGVCSVETECLLCFRKIQASDGAPGRSVLAPGDQAPPLATNGIQMT